MTNKKLESYLQKLEETLEEKPDKWFDDPKGTHYHNSHIQNSHYIHQN